MTYTTAVIFAAIALGIFAVMVVIAWLIDDPDHH